MGQAIIVLGSNAGDRKDMLQQAIQRLSFSNEILQISDIYETFAPEGQKRDPFLNVCLEIETDMTSGQLMQFLNETQRQLAGGEDDRFLHVLIDLDLIAFDDEVIRTPQLTLPHPDAFHRAFVIIPLAQMKPQWIHPILKETAAELAQKAFWPGWGTFFAHGKSLLDF